MDCDELKDNGENTPQEWGEWGGWKNNRKKKKKRKKNERYDKWRINKKERKNLIEDEIENKHYMLLINNNSTVKSCVHVLIKEI